MKQSEIELYVLGSGTCIPSLDRGPAGLIIKTDSKILLVDSGSGTLNKLPQIGVDYRKLDYLFYTHSHSDHTSDLVPILQALKVIPDFNRKDELFIAGPENFHNFLKILAQAYGDWVLELDCGINIQEFKNSEVELPFGKVITLPMKHSGDAIGYRFEFPSGKTITYSGDTDYCDEIITLAKDSDILILECSFPDNQKMEGHLTPSIAAAIAQKSNCKHLILTHFYPQFESIDILSICKKIYPGKINLAYDLMKIAL